MKKDAKNPHNICRRCNGRGQRLDKDEKTELQDRGKGKKPRFVTKHLGSGCQVCRGTGIVK